MVKKKRVDILLLERGLAESRSQAQRLIMAGQVRAAGQLVPKPASKVDPEVDLEVIAGPQFVSRGGEKLAAAFEKFDLDVNGKICADVGVSTGGFTDCLLQNGAAKVYAIDVGKGVLHWKLRNDPRVVVMESTNARYVDQLPEPVSFISVDASFISLRILLPVVKKWFSPSPPPSSSSGSSSLVGRGSGNEVADGGERKGEVVTLIKPQFEAGRQVVARGKGVVRDPKIHRQVLVEVLSFTEQENYQIFGLVPSPVLGPKGNIEFLAHLGFPQGETMGTENIEEVVYSMVSSDRGASAGN